MKEYEISYNNKNVGVVKLFNENINKDIKNSFIISENNIEYEILNYNTDMQQYSISLTINNVDDLYDIVSKYKYNEKDIFEEIDNIKKYNNIKNIRKDTTIKIIIPEIYLNNLNISKKNIDKESILDSKIYFVKKVLEKYNDNELANKLNYTINNYDNYKNNLEYEFYTDEEKESIIIETVDKVNVLIDILEDKTKYKYGKDFIIPIIINV